MSDETLATMTPDELRAWVERMRGEKRALMHRATQRFGSLVNFYDGVERVYASTLDGSLVDGPVIELSNGDAFVVDAHPEAVFYPLTALETRFYVMTTEALAAAVGEIAMAGASLGVSDAIGVPLLAAALRYQAHAIGGPTPAGEGDPS